MKSIVVKIASVALIIFFFLPMVSASMLGFSMSAAGFDLVGSNFLMILLLLMPIGLLIVSFVESTKKFETPAALIAAVVGIILLLTATNGVGNSFGLAKVGVGFILSLLTYIAIIAVIIYDAVTKNKKAGTAAPGSGS